VLLVYLKSKKNLILKVKVLKMIKKNLSEILILAFGLSLCSYYEEEIFHNKGKVLNRESDKAYTKAILDEIGKDDTKIVLDYGACTGRNLELINISDKSYMGFDRRENFLNYARIKFPNHHFVNKEPDDTDKFDLVICNDYLNIPEVPIVEDEDMSKIESIFQERLENIVKKANTSIFHFWVNDSTNYHEIEMFGEKLQEVFIGKDVIGKIIGNIEEKLKVKGSIEIFKKDKVSPFDCAVLVFKEV
jgi:hypothetical protein